MKSELEIEVLAYSKLQDAEYLLEDNRFDSAYYLAGYAIELLLKARVCKTLGIPDFFDFDNSERKKLKNESVITKPYKVHDFEQLLILSGIYTEYRNELLNNESFSNAWWIVSQWNENSRYLTGAEPKSVKSFIISVKEVMTWIKNYL